MVISYPGERQAGQWAWDWWAPPCLPHHEPPLCLKDTVIPPGLVLGGKEAGTDVQLVESTHHRWGGGGSIVTRMGV